MLGAIESGVDFEKRIADIYQRCRKPEEIKVAFDQLQLELSLEINEAMTQTRRKLLENFDDEVREKLKVSDEDVQGVPQPLRAPAHAAHPARAERPRRVSSTTPRFVLQRPGPRSSVSAPTIPLGLYELPRRSGEAHLYRLAHPLAEAVVAQAKSRELAPAEVRLSTTESMKA